MAGVVQWWHDRRSERERRAAREDRYEQGRAEVYRSFLIAAEALRLALRTDDASEADTRLNVLRVAAADIRLKAPGVAGAPLKAVLDAAERLHALVVVHLAAATVVLEAEKEFDQAVDDILDLMQADLGTAEVAPPAGK